MVGKWESVIIYHVGFVVKILFVEHYFKIIIIKS